MIVHPQLRALRDDDFPQRAAQEALIAAVARWRAQPPMKRILEELGRFAGGEDLSGCPALAELFEQGNDAAPALANDVAALGARGLSDHPLGHMPFRHAGDETISTLQLARAGEATLALVAIDGAGLAGRAAPVTADFSPSQIWEHILAGFARADVHDRLETSADSARLDHCSIDLHPGMVIARDARCRNVQLREVDGCIVMLRLQRRLPDTEPTREYRLADGEQVYQAAGHASDSRNELMMALLGRMGRVEAAPVMAQIAVEGGSSGLRWQALRECLALDTATGFAALDALARAPGDELAPAAGALRAQLIESWPQLKELVPCPA